MEDTDLYSYGDQDETEKRVYGDQIYHTGEGIIPKLQPRVEKSLRAVGLRKIFLRKVYAQDLAALSSQIGRGLYVHPSTEFDLLWHGVVFPTKGPYIDGIFRFDMKMPDTYPQRRPSVRFTSFIYHPQISLENGGIDQLITQSLPQWNPATHTQDLCNMLNLIIAMFAPPSLAAASVDTTQSANPGAASMYKTARENFDDEVNKCVNQSLDEYLDRQLKGNVIVFSEYSESKYGRARENIRNLNFDDFQEQSLIGGLKSTITSFMRG